MSCKKCSTKELLKERAKLKKHLNDRIARCDLDDRIDRAIHWELNNILDILKG